MSLFNQLIKTASAIGDGKSNEEIILANQY
jgi:hypothetical protein